MLKARRAGFTPNATCREPRNHSVVVGNRRRSSPSCTYTSPLHLTKDKKGQDKLERSLSQVCFPWNYKNPFFILSTVRVKHESDSEINMQQKQGCDETRPAFYAKTKSDVHRVISPCPTMTSRTARRVVVQRLATVNGARVV